MTLQMKESYVRQSIPGDIAVQVRALYAVMNTIEGQLGGGEGIEGLYGSLRGGHMQHILDCMQSHCGLDSSSHMVDVGAGLGRPLLHALLGVGIACASGIEIDHIKCLKADAFLRQVANVLKRRGTAPPKLELPIIRCSAIEHVPTLDPATHAYSFWEGVPVDARVAFGRLFARSTTMRCVAVVQRSMRSAHPAACMDEWYGFGPLKLAASFPVSMSGSGNSFQAYVFCRAELPHVRPPLATATAAAAIVPHTPNSRPTMRSRSRAAGLPVQPVTTSGIEKAGGCLAASLESTSQRSIRRGAMRLRQAAQVPAAAASEGSTVLARRLRSATVGRAIRAQQQPRAVAALLRVHKDGVRKPFASGVATGKAGKAASARDNSQRTLFASPARQLRSSSRLAGKPAAKSSASNAKTGGSNAAVPGNALPEYGVAMTRGALKKLRDQISGGAEVSDEVLLGV